MLTQTIKSSYISEFLVETFVGITLCVCDLDLSLLKRNLDWLAECPNMTTAFYMETEKQNALYIVFVFFIVSLCFMKDSPSIGICWLFL